MPAGPMPASNLRQSTNTQINLLILGQQRQPILWRLSESTTRTWWFTFISYYVYVLSPKRQAKKAVLSQGNRAMQRSFAYAPWLFDCHYFTNLYSLHKSGSKFETINNAACYLHHPYSDQNFALFPLE